jgi:hypothetical protein
MLKHAFKEWAVICQALAEGRQALILRKGGVAETQGEFRIEHTRFWLYPTYVHQQREGIKPEALPLLEQAEAEKPAPGTLRLSHFVEIAGIYHVHDLATSLMVQSLHLWSMETVTQRFHYRTPGLYVMPVRVFRAAQVAELADLPRYAGCRSWVELEQELPTDGAAPVLDDAKFTDLLRTLDSVFKPTAFV